MILTSLLVQAFWHARHDAKNPCSHEHARTIRIERQKDGSYTTTEV